MRALAVMLVLGMWLVAAGCGGHHQHAARRTTRATLPRIHEVFTVLPCPQKPSTTLDFEGCAEHRILRTDAAIERRARAIFALLRPQPRRAFVTAERSWLAYRHAACTVEASKYDDGTASPLVFGDCVAGQNERHLTELRQLERYL